MDSYTKPPVIHTERWFIKKVGKLILSIHTGNLIEIANEKHAKILHEYQTTCGKRYDPYYLDK